MNEKVLYFNGLKFTRDDKTGYYFNSTVRKLMHRYVWEHYNGSIPKGFQIHHIDFDKANNDIANLALLSESEHHKLHSSMWTDDEKEFYADCLCKNQHKAKAWHGSEQGKEYHCQHYKIYKDKMVFANKSRKTKKKKCVVCGSYFESKNAKRYCSKKCYMQARREAKIDYEQRLCTFCGNTFITRCDSSAKTCSRSCAQKLRYKI